MPRRKKRRHCQKLGEEAKAKGAFFRKFLDKELILRGRIKTIQDVLSTNYIGKSVLFGDLGIPDVNHIWIHLDEFKNYDVTKYNENKLLTIKGTVYAYSRDYKNKVWHIKYSLKNVEVLK